MTTNTIVKNNIKRETEEFIRKHNNGKSYFFFDSETKLTLEKSERGNDTISFTVETLVNFVRYKIYGYITELGFVSHYMIEYTIYDEELKCYTSKFVPFKKFDRFKF